MVELSVESNRALDFLMGHQPTASETKGLTDERSTQSSINCDEIHVVVIEIIEAWQDSKMKYFSEYLKWHAEERMYRRERSK
jgi:hypothetical protein